MTAPLDDAAWRRSNLGHALFVATGRCLGEVLRVVRASGFPDVTEAQLSLFGHLDGDGTRLTLLAARAGVTKQSTIELVDRAVRTGRVTRCPDPTDARAKIVRPTAEGERLMRAVRQGSAAATRMAGTTLGAHRRDALRRNLSHYAGRAAPLDQLLGIAARRFVRDVLAAVHPHGYAEVTEALLALFRHLDLQGSRLTEVAARARITKQSMRGLVERAEALALIERRPDGADRRARTIRFTDAGRTMLTRFHAGIEVAEQRFCEASAADLPAVKKALADLVEDGHVAPCAARISSVPGGAAVPNSPG